LYCHIAFNSLQIHQFRYNVPVWCHTILLSGGFYCLCYIFDIHTCTNNRVLSEDRKQWSSYFNSTL